MRISDWSSDVCSSDLIWFVGEYKHDNGITFGARVELEAFSTDSQIDNRFIYVEGDFGRIEAGSRQSAGSQMTYAALFAGDRKSIRLTSSPQCAPRLPTSPLKKKHQSHTN